MKVIINCAVVIALAHGILLSPANAGPVPPAPPTRPVTATPPPPPVRPALPTPGNANGTSSTNNNVVAGTPVTTTSNGNTTTVNCSSGSNCSVSGK
ncbi:hypothetical protein ACO0LL_21750 [Undibacterium sp. TC4M20W]|uniref:hypothetical protein n=1 Tax=unclassified Undibacterium TaxID=2630295 RepID=UPI003BF08DE5